MVEVVVEILLVSCALLRSLCVKNEAEMKFIVPLDLV